VGYLTEEEPSCSIRLVDIDVLRVDTKKSHNKKLQAEHDAIDIKSIFRNVLLVTSLGRLNSSRRTVADYHPNSAQC
jgi:hypothetical protein